MGRKKLWAERILVTLAEGVSSRIDGYLTARETRLDFIRAAIDNEISRRRKKAQRKEELPD
jgi:metal-responsive CopG/Arc/MetJ family transcriptional regulator